MRALAIAATGMDAQQTNLEVIANNIANINTTGFKRARAEFSDLLYQTERAQGVPNRANQRSCRKAPISASASRRRLSATCTSRANCRQTGNDLDVALIGRGFFQVEIA